MLTEATVRASLAEIPYPGLSRDIVSLGLVRSVAVRNDRVHVSLTLASPREDVPERLREAISERLARAGAIRSEVQILAPGGRLPARSDPWAESGAAAVTRTAANQAARRQIMASPEGAATRRSAVEPVSDPDCHTKAETARTKAEAARNSQKNSQELGR